MVDDNDDDDDDGGERTREEGYCETDDTNVI